MYPLLYPEFLEYIYGAITEQSPDRAPASEHSGPPGGAVYTARSPLEWVPQHVVIEDGHRGPVVTSSAPLRTLAMTLILLIQSLI